MRKRSHRASDVVGFSVWEFENLIFFIIDIFILSKDLGLARNQNIVNCPAGTLFNLVYMTPFLLLMLNKKRRDSDSQIPQDLQSVVKTLKKSKYQDMKDVVKTLFKRCKTLNCKTENSQLLNGVKTLKKIQLKKSKSPRFAERCKRCKNILKTF